MNRREYYGRSSQLFDGDNVAFDESHELVKGIRVDNIEVYSGVFTATISTTTWLRRCILVLLSIEPNHE